MSERIFDADLPVSSFHFQTEEDLAVA